MAIKSTGEIGLLSDIVAEFGGDAPHNISEYMGEIPKTTDVAWSDFYGLSAIAMADFSITMDDVITENGDKYGNSVVFFLPPIDVPLLSGDVMTANGGVSGARPGDNGVPVVSAGNAYVFPGFFDISEATFNALNKTFLRTCEDVPGNYTGDYYGVDPLDLGYTHISFKGETKELREATFDMTVDNPFHNPSGVVARRLYDGNDDETNYSLSFLADFGSESDFIDAAEVGMSFRQDIRSGVLTFTGV